MCSVAVAYDIFVAYDAELPDRSNPCPYWFTEDDEDGPLRCDEEEAAAAD